MIANRNLDVVVAVVGLAAFPVQIVSTFVLVVLVECMFGLVLLPISLVWMAGHFVPSPTGSRAGLAQHERQVF